MCWRLKMRILRAMNAVPASWYYRTLTELQEMKDRERTDDIETRRTPPISCGIDA